MMKSFVVGFVVGLFLCATAANAGVIEQSRTFQFLSPSGQLLIPFEAYTGSEPLIGVTWEFNSSLVFVWGFNCFGQGGLPCVEGCSTIDFVNYIAVPFVPDLVVNQCFLLPGNQFSVSSPPMGPNAPTHFDSELFVCQRTGTATDFTPYLNGDFVVNVGGTGTYTATTCGGSGVFVSDQTYTGNLVLRYFTEDNGDECLNCPDVTGDTNVDIFDLISIITFWGSTDGGPTDVNCDGIVDVNDLIEVILSFGTNTGCAT